MLKALIAKWIAKKGLKGGIVLVILILEIISKNTKSKKDDKIVKKLNPILKDLKKWVQKICKFS